MYLHPTYAVTPEREPLGIVNAWMWAREKKDRLGKRGGPKESLRWTEGYERIAEMAANLPHTGLVYVADREADLMPLMLLAQALGTPADWLVHAAHNRCLPDGEKLLQYTSAGEPVGEIAFAMAARHGVKARTVRQQLWVRRVELTAGKGRAISATCVIAREVDAPARVKPIEWRLLTNRKVGSTQETIELIEWSRALGNRDLVRRSEERVPDRGAAAGIDQAAGTCVGVVHGGGMAHCTHNEARKKLPRPGRRHVLRAR